MTNASVSYRGLLDNATRLLHDASGSPRIDAEVLLQHVVERPLVWLISHAECDASGDQIKRYYQLVAQRQEGQPIAYLIGRRDFWSLSLTVNENVLIPRPDSETVVERALERLPAEVPARVLDLGTGSGAIALAIAKERPLARVLAVDYQPDALVVAKHNQHLNDIPNVEFVLSDWFQNIPETRAFELIVSNPPYVQAGDPHLQQGDLRFEPQCALVAEEQGLADLQHIIMTAPNYLTDQGWLVVEHGYNQAEAIAQLFNQCGFTNIANYRDINDLPRCSLGQLA